MELGDAAHGAVVDGYDLVALAEAAAVGLAALPYQADDGQAALSDEGYLHLTVGHTAATAPGVGLEAHAPAPGTEHDGSLLQQGGP